MQNTFNRLVHVSTRLAGQARGLIPSYGRSACFGELPALRVDILRRVKIAVVVLATLWTIPLPGIERETGQNVAAGAATFAAWEEAVHKPQFPSVPLAFVFEHLTKLTETGIRDRLGEAVVFHHTPYIQVFDANTVVPAHQIGSHFVQVVLSGVADVLLYPGNTNALPVPPSATLGFASEDALCLCKPSLVFARMLRVVDASSIAQGGESVYSQVNAHRFPGWVEFGKLFIQNQCDEISSTGTFGYCDSRWFRLELAAPFNIKPPQPGYNQVWIAGVWSGKLESGSRIFSRLHVSLPFEDWIPSLLIEELHESVVQMAKSLLDGNAGHIAQPRGFFLTFPFSQFSGSLIVSDSLLPFLPSVSPIPQRPVVNITAATEHPSELALLSLGWRPSELVSNLHTNNLYV